MPLCWSSLFLPPCRDGYSVGCNGRTSRSGRLSSMGSPALEEDGIFLNSNNSKLLERAQGILMWVTYHKVTVVFLFVCLFLIILNPVYHAEHSKRFYPASMHSPMHTQSYSALFCALQALLSITHTLTQYMRSNLKPLTFQLVDNPLYFLSFARLCWSNISSDML